MIEGEDGRLRTMRANRFFMLVFSALMAFLFISASIGISVHDHTFRQPSIVFPLPFYVVLLILLAACFLKNRTTLLPKIPLSLLLVVGVLILATMASSVLNVERATDAIRVLVVQTAILCLAFYAFFTLTRAGVDPLAYFLRFLIVFGLASLAFAILLFTRGSIRVGFATMEQFPDYMRLYGWYGNPNLFGSAMGVATLAAYALLMQGRTIRLGRVILFACLFVGVVLSGSKAVLASIVATIGFVHVMEMLPRRSPDYPLPEKPWKLAALGTMLLFALTPFFVVFYDVFVEILKLDNPDITSGRIELWRQSFDFFASAGSLQVLFGNGLNFHRDFLGFSAHSFYIRSLIEEGVIFISFFMITNVIFIYILFRRMRLGSSAQKNVAQFTFLIVLFMFLRNFATPSFFQVRVENIVYIFCIALFSRVTALGDPGFLKAGVSVRREFVREGR